MNYEMIPRVVCAEAYAYVRRDTADNWSAVNPILEDREIAYETDTDRFKMGDGKTVWNDLEHYARS